MKKRVFSVLSIVLILCFLTISAYGLEVPDLSRTGSISVSMTYQGEPVPGGSLTLYRVAQVHVTGGANYSFRYVPEYEGCEADLGDLTTAGLAQSLAEYTAEQEISGVTLQIDENGNVTFPDLELGLYLLVQEEPAEGFNPANPFLVSVPGKQGESYIYDVDASPKLNLTIAPTEPTEPSTEPTEPPPPELPQTGQNNLAVPFLAVTGLALFAMGWILMAAGKDKRYEA